MKEIHPLPMKKMTNYTKAQPKSIKALFNNIAKRYDFTNSVISFNLSKRWNRKIADYASQKSSESFSMLDLCSGTGEVAFECLKKTSHQSKAYLLDFSSEMLKIAQEKSDQTYLKQHGIEYIEADAQEIPLSNEIIDFSTIAYGIRNIHDPAKCFQEVYRVLKPGGCLAILELTRPNNRLLRFGHKVYLTLGLPLIGKLLTSDKNAYEYLCQSIDNFISPKEIEKLLIDKKFERVKSIPLAGGIATIILAYKK